MIPIGQQPTTPCITIGGKRRSYVTVNGKRVPRYRAVYAGVHGWDAIEGLQIHHACDNPLCVRYGHLRVGTPSENMVDMVLKGRHINGNRGKTHCKHGHEFTEENTFVNKRGWRICRACWRRPREV